MRGSSAIRETFSSGKTLRHAGAHNVKEQWKRIRYSFGPTEGEMSGERTCKRHSAMQN